MDVPQLRFRQPTHKRTFPIKKKKKNERFECVWIFSISFWKRAGDLHRAVCSANTTKRRPLFIGRSHLLITNPEREHARLFFGGDGGGSGD